MRCIAVVSPCGVVQTKTRYTLGCQRTDSGHCCWASGVIARDLRYCSPGVDPIVMEAARIFFRGFYAAFLFVIHISDNGLASFGQWNGIIAQPSSCPLDSVGERAVMREGDRIQHISAEIGLPRPKLAGIFTGQRDD